MSEERIISCEEALRVLAQYLDGELDHTRRDEVEAHLARCRSCYSRSEFEQRLRSRLGALRQEPVEPAFEARVRTLIGTFVAGPEE